MAAAFQEQLEKPSLTGLSFEDRFAMLVDREWNSREDRKLTKRLRMHGSEPAPQSRT